MLKDRVSEICKEKNILQKDLAERMGVSAPGLSLMISGNPTLDNLQKMADALEVHISELFAKPDGIVVGIIKDNVRYDLTAYDLRRAIELKEKE